MDEIVADAKFNDAARALAALRAGAGAPVDLAWLDIADAYRLQFALEALLVAESGYQPIGWKIGATNAGARAALGLEAPFLGRLYRQMTWPNPAKVEFRSGFHRAYEAEIALEIDRDLDGRDGPYDAAAIRAATRAVAPAIELVGSRLSAGAGLIADLAGHAQWIVGPKRTDFSALDLMEAPIRFTIDGETKATGKGAAVEGGAFGATAWLANTLVALGRGLKAGEYVTTGTVIAPQPMGAGQSARADFGPLGTIEVSIV